VLAESLFDQGRELMEAGKYDEACPKLAESQRIDPAGGTLINLGLCYEKGGKLASAWAAFKEARVLARQQGRADRVSFSVQHIKSLEPRLSHVTISVPASRRVNGLTVKLDGRRIAPAAWGAPIPLDRGEHLMQAAAPGHEPWSARVTIGDEGQSETVELPALEQKKPTAAAPPPLPKKREPGPKRDAVVAEPAAEEVSSNSPVVGYVLVGTGVAAAGVGSYFGAKAFSSWSDRNDHCPDGRCDTQGVELGDDTKSNATIANVALGLGLVSAGIGTYFILSFSGESSTEVGDGVALDFDMGPDALGARVRGTW